MVEYQVFPSLKKTNVGYFYTPDNFLHPSMEQEITKINSNNYGCPAIGGLNNSLFSLNSFLNVDIEFGINNDLPYYKYLIDEKLHSTSNAVHTLIKNICDVQLNDNGQCVLQITTPVVFVTDSKDLQMTILHPQDNVDKTNCVKVIGSFYPYAWLRPINISYVQLNKNKLSTINLSTNNPVLNILFNKRVNLKEIKPNKKILDYMSLSYDIVSYNKNIKSYFKRIHKKRPKRML